VNIQVARKYSYGGRQALALVQPGALPVFQPVRLTPQSLLRISVILAARLVAQLAHRDNKIPKSGGLSQFAKIRQ